MNKFGMVIGVAAVAVIAGCKDPDYKYGGTQTNTMSGFTSSSITR